MITKKQILNFIVQGWVYIDFQKNCKNKKLIISQVLLQLTENKKKTVFGAYSLQCLQFSSVGRVFNDQQKSDS